MYLFQTTKKQKMLTRNTTEDNKIKQNRVRDMCLHNNYKEKFLPYLVLDMSDLSKLLESIDTL